MANVCTNIATLHFKDVSQRLKLLSALNKGSQGLYQQAIHVTLKFLVSGMSGMATVTHQEKQSAEVGLPDLSGLHKEAGAQWFFTSEKGNVLGKHYLLFLAYINQYDALITEQYCEQVIALYNRSPLSQLQWDDIKDDDIKARLERIIQKIAFDHPAPAFTDFSKAQKPAVSLADVSADKWWNTMGLPLTANYDPVKNMMFTFDAIADRDIWSTVNGTNASMMLGGSLSAVQGNKLTFGTKGQDDDPLHSMLRVFNGQEKLANLLSATNDELAVVLELDTPNTPCDKVFEAAVENGFAQTVDFYHYELGNAVCGESQIYSEDGQLCVSSITDDILFEDEEDFVVSEPKWLAERIN